MKVPVRFDLGALDDLETIEVYLADRFYPENAAKFVQRIIDTCNSLGFAPNRGRVRGDARSDVRSISFERRATITYKTDPEGVLILGIFYGGRQPH